MGPFSYQIVHSPFLVGRCVSCRQQIGGFCLLILSVGLRLLIGEPRLLIFKVVSEMCVLVVVLVLSIFCVFVCITSGILCFNNYGFVFLSAVSLMYLFQSST